MVVWRYMAMRRASDATGAGPPAVPTMIYGEASGGTPADVRASLRRIGLQVIDLRPIGPRNVPLVKARMLGAPVARLVRGWQAHLRRRRRAAKGDLFDGLATLLESGIALVESLETVSASAATPRRVRALLVGLRERVRGGGSLSQAMSDEPAWFDETEVAIVRAGQHGGDLIRALRRLAKSHERAAQLNHRLAMALTYPAVLSIVGLAVVVLLGTRILPALVGVLTDAQIETPALTRATMTIGTTLARAWPVVVLLSVLGFASAALVRHRIWLPRLFREMAVAQLARRLAELTASGVPLVEALRVAGPTTSLISLRASIFRAADRLEQGDDVAAAFDDPQWFDPEFRHLLAIAQQTGELAQLLLTVSERTTRRAGRLIDRASAVLEPTIILVLAGLISLIVMAAILPLIRLQEMFR